MINRITITNYLGDSLELDLRRPELSGFAVKSIDGLGPAGATINVTDIVTDDGGSFNSARLNKRNIVFKIVFRENGYESIEDLRQKSYKYFPEKRNLTLLIETENRIVRVDGYTEHNDPTIFSKEAGTTISIICPDPHLYSTGKNGVIETVFYGVQAAFEFPFENNSIEEPLLEFGIIKNQTENVITYKGDSEIGITISIHAIGEAGNITIYNTGTRESMKIDTSKLETLTGASIIAGDTITICTSVTLLRNGVETNILNCLSKGSKWFTLARGDNIFAYKAESGSTNLQFSIKNQIIYDGV